MYYCDKDCQKLDWKAAHRFECPVFKSIDDMTLAQSTEKDKLPLRLILLVAKKPSVKKLKYKLHDQRERCLEDLMSHEEQIKLKDDNVQVFKFIANILQNGAVKFDPKEAFKNFCRVVINSFVIGESKETSLGLGLYIEGSVFDRSCQPNAFHYFEDIELRVKAMKSIEDEPVFIHYVDLLNDKATRKSILFDLYFFDCQCLRCDSNFDDNVEYKKLIDWENSFANQSKNSLQTLKTALEILKIQEEIFSGYHRSLTNLMVFIIDLWFQLKIKYNEAKLNKIAKNIGVDFSIEKIRKSLLITHGHEHEVYNEFEKIIRN